MAALTDRTPAGSLAFCDYLLDKGYATASQINPWRTAIQKVFETVEREGWEDLDLTMIDLDEYLSRFQTLAGAQYKAESIAAYKRRIRNAIDAHNYYLDNGRPPSFRQGGKRAAKTEEKQPAKVVPMEKPTAAPAAAAGTTDSGMVDFPYPLGDGRMVTLRLPVRLKPDDVNRLCASSGRCRTTRRTSARFRAGPAERRSWPPSWARQTKGHP